MKKTNKLFLFKKPKINHFIKLKKINHKISQTLWKPLYNMFHNKLLILRKILNDSLNKKFIRTSNSLIVSFILFVQKPDEKLRFYMNYCALNKFTRKNHYLLLLIHETLNNILKTKWFMKLDIITVFYKFHIVESDEWLIIFFWFDECIEQFSTIYQLGWPRRIGIPSEVRRFDADESIFGRKSDPIAEAETKNFENSIRFNSIKLTHCLIGLKRIGLDEIFRFFVKSGRIHFYFLSDRKKKTASDPIRWPL